MIKSISITIILFAICLLAVECAQKLQLVTHRDILSKKNGQSMTVAVRSFRHKKYLSYENSKNRFYLNTLVTNNKRRINMNQLFKLTFLDNEVVTLQEMTANRFVTVYSVPQSWLVTTNVAMITTNEKFKIQTFGLDYISLNSLFNRRYIVVDSLTGLLCATSLSAVDDIYNIFEVQEKPDPPQPEIPADEPTDPPATAHEVKG